MNRLINNFISFLCRHCSYLYSDVFWDACDAFARDKTATFNKNHLPKAYASVWELAHKVSEN